MTAIAIFSNECGRDFVGLVAADPAQSQEILDLAKSVDAYYFYKAGSDKAADVLLQAFQTLQREAG